MLAPEDALELLASTAYDDGAITQVIRPAAVLPELAARAVVAELMLCDARRDGVWVAEPTCWRRYDQSWDGADGGPGSAREIGALQIVYGMPGRYEITVFRVTVSAFGAELGWTVESLCGEAFGYGGLTLAACPRADLRPPPQPFRMR